MSTPGRKQRNTVDFFPHYVRDSKTKSILKNKFGLAGYAIWFQLLEVLCKSKDHYFNCQDEWDYEWLLSEIGTDKETFEEIMEFLLRFEKIDAELWEKKIIWCQNLVENLDIVYRKRVLEIPSKPTFLLQKSPEKPISGAEIDNSVPEKPISDNFRPKSRVEYIREEESSTLSDSEKANPTALAENGYTKNFEVFWITLPSQMKVGKKNAYKHYKASVKNQQDYSNLKQALENYKRTDRFKRGIIQNGSTWFNNWRDWLEYQETDKKSIKEIISDD